MPYNSKRRITLTILALALATLTLGACQQTNRGYGSYPKTTNASAQSAPNTLGTPSTNDLLNNTQSSPNAANLPTVKVGILLPLTGQHSRLGTAMLNAAQMALFDVGHTNLELIPRDTKGTAEGGQAAAQAAINDGAQIILGPVFAPAVRAAKPVTSRARVNMIAFSTDWTLAGGNTFIMGFVPFDQVERVTNYAASQGVTNAGIITPSSAYGNIVKSAFERATAANRIALTQSKTYSAGTTNLAPVVREFTGYDMKTPAPYQAVMMPVGGQDARAIASLLTHYGQPPRNIRRLGTGLFDEAALASEKNLEGAWFAAPSPNSRRTFENNFASTFGTQAPRLATLSFDATALAAVLARRGLETSGRPAFDTGSITNPNGFSGLDGIFRFRGDNTVERGLAVLEFRNGQVNVVSEAPRTFQNLSQ